MKKQTGIFTTFANFDTAYSLVSVVRDQLVSHVKNGYTPILFVLEDFIDEDKVPEGVEIRKIVPRIILEPYQGVNVPECVKEDVAKIKEALIEHAKDIEIMLTHDIIFIDTYLPYNIGLREAELSCKFFHWIHSAPSPRQEFKNNLHANRYTLPANSKLVYLNNDKTIHLAEMYGTYLKNVKVIHNSRDPRTFWDLDPFVSNLIDKYDLLSKDIISIYPVSTPRMVAGKQIDVVIKIHKALRALGYKTALIVPNAHANAEEHKKLAQERASTDVIFTSLQDDKYEHGVSSKIVSDLFRLSNVFIFPSISENCSLVLLEAMLSGNLLVLNRDCSGLQEFGGNNAIYLKFGNIDMGIRNEEDALNKDEYLTDVAKIIKSEFENNKALKAKSLAFQKFNYDTIFSKIEELYYE